jgi:hypothetical protein
MMVDTSGARATVIVVLSPPGQGDDQDLTVNG